MLCIDKYVFNFVFVYQNSIYFILLLFSGEITFKEQEKNGL